MKNKTSIGGWIVAIIVLVAAIGGGTYLIRKGMQGSSQNSTASMPPALLPSPGTAATPPVIEHPISSAQSGPAPASTAPLPTLGDSDASVAAQLASLAGGNTLGTLLIPEHLVGHIVATVDALPRQGIGSNYILPLHTPKGLMVVDRNNGMVTIGQNNASRYEPYMAIVENANPHTLVAWYKHTYPLFQEAYRELGYPHGYFNDRLITAIDDMLNAPEPQDPVALIPPNPSNPHYLYADPHLQSLSVGQKLMIRMGPKHEAAFKNKLRTIRSLLSTAPVQP